MAQNKTLYLSDLDGTLLRSDERVSEYTANVINRFVQNGGCFSYATARSIITASKITVGLKTEFPVICYNGAFIIENTTNEILSSNFFAADEVEFVSEILNKHNIYPVTYSYANKKERFSYIARYATPAMKYYLDSRIGDPRRYEVEFADELYSGNIFSFVCMDTEVTLSPINDIFKTDNRFNCIYYKEWYSEAQWCELSPANATKANAALLLKAMLGCDKLIVFGDYNNDISLFSVADEKYAMSNAVPELKAIATAVIDSNDDDGVAKWIERNAF